MHSPAREDATRMHGTTGNPGQPLPHARGFWDTTAPLRQPTRMPRCVGTPRRAGHRAADLAVQQGICMSAIATSTDALRTALATHPLATHLDSPDAVRRFMQHHVFCVWDFMSLLKRLQRDLTCVTVPWMPPADPVSARLVNEIVRDEESDEVNGTVYSHFELYLAAMREVGADTRGIDAFIAGVRAGDTPADALVRTDVPDVVRRFVTHTLDVAQNGTTAAVAGAFFLGREALIPGLFQPLLDAVRPQAEPRLLEAYLARHIELDGDEHGPQALSLLERVCAGDQARIHEAQQAATLSLELRAALWSHLCG